MYNNWKCYEAVLVSSKLMWLALLLKFYVLSCLLTLVKVIAILSCTCC